MLPPHSTAGHGTRITTCAAVQSPAAMAGRQGYGLVAFCFCFNSAKMRFLFNIEAICDFIV